METRRAHRAKAARETWEVYVSDRADKCDRLLCACATRAQAAQIVRANNAESLAAHGPHSPLFYLEHVDPSGRHAWQCREYEADVIGGEDGRGGE